METLFGIVLSTLSIGYVPIFTETLGHVNGGIMQDHFVSGNTMANFKWDHRFLELAKTVSTWSKDPSTKVGAVIVDPLNRIVSVGYNGFPRGCDDSTALYENREIKYARTVHAEVNAILTAGQGRSTGATLYTWPFQPCSTCSGLIIQSGITRVVSCYSYETRWVANFAQAVQMFRETGIELKLYDNDCI